MIIRIINADALIFKTILDLSRQREAFLNTNKVIK